MFRVKEECRENAIGMLESRHARFLGWVGNLRYYVVDGVAWSRTLEGAVARAENPDESEAIIAMVRHLNPN